MAGERDGFVNADAPIDHVAAVSVGIVDGEVLLDLEYESDVAADVDMNVVMSGRGELVEVQGTAEHKTFTASSSTPCWTSPSRGSNSSSSCRGRRSSDPRLLIATKNAGKREEMAAILVRLGVAAEVVTDVDWPDVEETGETLEENALLKARAAVEATGLRHSPTTPGSKSRRSAGRRGAHRPVRRSPRHLRRQHRQAAAELDGVADRRFRFRTVVALAFPDGDYVTPRAASKVASPKSGRGDTGFGYDPVFEVGGRTFAEMSSEEKNLLSIGPERWKRSGEPSVCDRVGERTRTSTDSRPPGPKPGASSSSATPARIRREWWAPGTRTLNQRVKSPLLCQRARGPATDNSATLGLSKSGAVPYDNNRVGHFLPSEYLGVGTGRGAAW